MKNRENNIKEENEMEQWDDIKDKNKPIKIIIIVILIIIILSGGLIFINKDTIFNKKEIKHNTTTKKKKKETKEEYSKEIEKENDTVEDNDSIETEEEKYISYISPVNTRNSNPPEKLYNVDKVEANKLSAREKIEYIAGYLYDKHTSSSDYKYNILPESVVKDTVEKIYGPNTYQRTTFNLGCDDYTYKLTDGKYYSQTGCGGTTAISSKNIIIDHTKTKEKIEITTAYAFYNATTNKIYKDYDMQEAIENYKGDSTTIIEEYLTKYIKNNKKTLNHIVYTFESEDGKNYYFKSFENKKQE